jgi:hypothetical protein
MTIEESFHNALEDTSNSLNINVVYNNPWSQSIKPNEYSTQLVSITLITIGTLIGVNTIVYYRPLIALIDTGGQAIFIKKSCLPKAFTPTPVKRAVNSTTGKGQISAELQGEDIMLPEISLSK